MKLVKLILLCLVVQSCTSSYDAPGVIVTEQVESNGTETTNLVLQNDTIPAPIKAKPQINVIDTLDGCGGLLILDPVSSRFELSNSRPSKDSSSVMLCVPAAYTSPETTIEGAFIMEGKIINQSLKETSGAILLQPNGYSFLKPTELNKDIIKEAAQNNTQLFQQSLLIIDKTPYPCNLPKGKCDEKRMRRALAELNSRLVMVQTKGKTTMSEFQECLVKAGVSNAIYLDMGTWSEGWYLDSTGKPITIGENMTNTNKQTNWLILVEKP